MAQLSSWWRREYPWYTISWRVIGYPVLAVVLGGLYLITLVVANQAIVYRNQQLQQSYQQQLVLADLFIVNQAYNQLLPDLMHIDRELPGLSTTQVDLLHDRLGAQVRNYDYGDALETIQQIESVTRKILSAQDELMVQEVERLDALIAKNMEQITLLIGDPFVVRAKS